MPDSEEGLPQRALLHAVKRAEVHWSTPLVEAEHVVSDSGSERMRMADGGAAEHGGSHWRIRVQGPFHRLGCDREELVGY